MRATSRMRDCFRIHSCGEESLRYWPMDVMWRASWRMLSQAERQTREMRRFAMERGKGRGVMFTSDKAILAAASATLLPLTPGCEGTHWKMMFQPSVLRWRRVCCVAWMRLGGGRGDFLYIFCFKMFFYLFIYLFIYLFFIFFNFFYLH